MGSLVDGVWQARDARHDAGGHFVRPETRFRNWITADGAPGPTGTGGFPAEPGRYHLYVSLACPWAHRTLILRALKGLSGMVGLSVTHWLTGEQGWSFAPAEGVIADPLFGAEYLHQIYTSADPACSGRVSVPVLWDRARSTIVSNESAEIIRMFNTAFDAVGAAPGDYAPAALLPEIDALNARIFATLNNGVYHAGFATTQAAYEAAITPLFDTLSWLKRHLFTRRFLCGAQPTEADWRLFTTLVRFDAVYAGHFKCNLRRLVDYPNLWAYTRDLFQWPGVRDTVNLLHIKRHYYMSHRDINPTGIVPMGPLLDFDLPAGRA